MINKITFFRKAKNFSQEDFASKLGITQIQYSRYENHAEKIPAELWSKAANILNVPVEILQDEAPFILMQHNPNGGNYVNAQGVVQYSNEKLVDELSQSHKREIEAKDETIKILKELVSNK